MDKNKQKQINSSVAYLYWKRCSKDVKNFLARKSEFISADRSDLFEQKYEILCKREMNAYHRFTFQRDMQDSIDI